MDKNDLFGGSFGLERETLRVDSRGMLAQTLHPFKDNKNLDRDFCENQLEIITPVCKSIDELMSSLAELDNEARREIAKNSEYLWLCSNPPHIDGEDDIPIALYDGDMAFKHDYRVKLQRRYGKKHMLLSGIHFNFSFDSSFFRDETKDDMYFRLSKQVFRYSWLPVLLTAASPVYDVSFEDGGTGSGFCGLASYRNSAKGYWNQFIPILDYTDIRSYAGSVNEYIKKGVLFSEGELYVPVRLKSRGANSLDSLVKHGVDHIELRMFDLNPLSPVGIFKEDLEFAHYFMLYLIRLPDFEFTPALQEKAVHNHHAASLYDMDKISINGYPAAEAALGLLDDMAEYFRDNKRVLMNIGLQKEKILTNKRYCVKLCDMLKDNYQSTMLEISKKECDRNV